MNSGDQISRYRIIGPLGKGGMGEVYRAEDTRLQRPVALKFLPQDSLTEKDKKRFLNEAQSAALIRHPNVCPIYDVEEADGQIFIAMAYLEGETLARRIALGPLDIGLAIDIAMQIANGLEQAHELGIVHRDIKSTNVILSAGGHASILDFGLALRSGFTRLTGEGRTAGTPAYMSPEQARGLEVDRRTDIWSLGVLLFEMVTGRVPFMRDHQAALVHAILTDGVPPVSSLRPEAPEALGKVIETALAKKPDRRWQRAKDMAAELKRIQGTRTDAGIEGLRTQTLFTEATPAIRWRRRIVALILIALCVIAAAVFAYYKLHRADAGQPAIARTAPETQEVAVLPFRIIGPDANAGIISDGLVEILTAALSDLERFQGKIIAVPASEIRRRRIDSPEEARRVYGAKMAIAGSVQPLGKTLQFTLTLIDTAQLRQIGARTFEYNPAKPMESRDHAVDQMARLLRVDLTPAAHGVVTAGDTATPGAYTAYLEGRGYLSRYDVRGNLEKAIDTFQRATQTDPNYALAWAGLGEAYWRKSRADGDKQSAVLAIESAERAVQLDPSLAIVHSVLGEVYGTSGREEDAIRELRKAMELAPANAEAPRELARIYANLGRFKEAEASYLQATKSRPTDWYGHLLLGLFYYERERYQEAETPLRRALEFAPGNDIVSRNLGVVYQLQGRYTEAVAELQKSLRSRTNAATYNTLASTYYRQHKFQEAVSALETAIDLDSTRYYYWGNLGIYYKWTPGEAGKATAALRKAIELGEKLLEVTPNNYDIRADLAEYRARLGDVKGALGEVDRIPEPARQARASRVAIAYELTGHRANAIELIRSKVTNPASLNQIKDDPDLAALWTDPAFQKAIQQTAKSPAR